MREEAEPIQLVHIFTEMERWDKFTEAELNYMHKYAHEEKAVVTECMHADDHKHVKYFNRRFAIGEVVLDRVTKCAGIVARFFERSGLYVIFPQYDEPQLVCARNMEKLNED
jgi:hypothetical protein